MSGDHRVWPAPFPRRPGPASADAADGYRWAVFLVGGFGEHGSRHCLTCPSEEAAERRAAWWRAWRSDVVVTVCEWVGGYWRPRPDGGRRST